MSYGEEVVPLQSDKWETWGQSGEGLRPHSLVADIKPRSQRKAPRILLIDKNAELTIKAVSSKTPKEYSAGHPFVHI